MRGSSVLGRHRAARDHTHALFRTQSHSFLANAATLFGGRRQCSHMAVTKPAVIAPGLYTLASVCAQPFETVLPPQTSQGDGMTCPTSSFVNSPSAIAALPACPPHPPPS